MNINHAFTFDNSGKVIGKLHLTVAFVSEKPKGPTLEAESHQATDVWSRVSAKEYVARKKCVFRNVSFCRRPHFIVA